MTSAREVPPSIPRSVLISSSTGVTMVEEKGEMNVKQETSMVATHFLCHDQLSGFSGSWGPSQDTNPLSSPVGVGEPHRPEADSGGSSFVTMLL